MALGVCLAIALLGTFVGRSEAFTISRYTAHATLSTVAWRITVCTSVLRYRLDFEIRMHPDESSAAALIHPRGDYQEPGCYRYVFSRANVFDTGIWDSRLTVVSGHSVKRTRWLAFYMP